MTAKSREIGHLDDTDDRRLAAPATLGSMTGNRLRPSWACYVWDIERQFRAHVEDRRTNQTSYFRARDICRYSRQATTGFAAAARRPLERPAIFFQVPPELAVRNYGYPNTCVSCRSCFMHNGCVSPRLNHRLRVEGESTTSVWF